MGIGFGGGYFQGFTVCGNVHLCDRVNEITKLFTTLPCDHSQYTFTNSKQSHK